MQQDGRTEEGKLYSLAEAADYLGIQKNSMYAYAHKRVIASSQDAEGYLWFTQEALDRYRDQRGRFTRKRRPFALVAQQHGSSQTKNTHEEEQALYHVIKQSCTFLQERGHIVSIRSLREVPQEEVHVWEVETPQMMLHVYVTPEHVSVQGQQDEEIQALHQEVHMLRQYLHKAQAQLYEAQQQQQEGNSPTA